MPSNDSPDHKKVPDIIGRHNFEWLFTQTEDQETLENIEKIIAIEKGFMNGKPLSVTDKLMCLNLCDYTIWTRESMTHSIPFGFTQIFKSLDEELPPEFRGPFTGTIIDLGANEGHWTLYMRRRNPEAKIIAAEPNPLVNDLFERNMETNHIKNVVLEKIAVGSKDETREFEIIPEVSSLGSFSIDRTGRSWLTPDRIKKINVQVTTLDALAAAHEITAIDLLKVDVECAELEVIMGASATLPKIKRIEIEYGTETNHRTLLEILGGAGFTLLLDDVYSPGRGDLFFIRK